MNAIKGSFFVLCLAFLFLTAILPVRPGGASLGGSLDSVEADRRSLSAVSGGATAHRGYEVHEMRNDAVAVRSMDKFLGRALFSNSWSRPESIEGRAASGRTALLFRNISCITLLLS